MASIRHAKQREQDWAKLSAKITLDMPGLDRDGMMLVALMGDDVYVSIGIRDCGFKSQDGMRSSESWFCRKLYKLSRNDVASQKGRRNGWNSSFILMKGCGVETACEAARTGWVRISANSRGVAAQRHARQREMI